MEFLIIIMSITALLIWALLTGFIAMTFGRKFRFWFVLGMVLPFISLIILHCLPYVDNAKNANDKTAADLFTFEDENDELRKSG